MSLIKFAALELTALDNSDIVKTAGVLRRVKNWFKKLTDPAYAIQLNKLRETNEHIQPTLDALKLISEQTSAALKDGDITSFDESFDKLKQTAKSFIDLLKDQNETAKELAEYYSIDDMSSPDFQESTRKYLPSDFTLEFGKIYNTPLSKVAEYQWITSQSISISEKSLNILYNTISKELNTNVDKSVLSVSFIEGIRNGNLHKVLPSSPSDTKKAKSGSVDLTIYTAPFIITPTNPAVRDRYVAEVILYDSGARNILTVKKIRGIKKVTLASFISDLEKYAFADGLQSSFVTNLSELDFARVMEKGYEKTFGEKPSLPTLAAGTSQAMLEMGRPVKLPNNNVGNIKATDKWVKSGKPYFVTESTVEFTKDGKKYLHEQPKWRAFASPVEGAASYWSLLKNNYADSIDWMAAGDPVSAGVSLGEKGYYTANIRKYSGAMGDLYNEFMKKYAGNFEHLNKSIRPVSKSKPVVRDFKQDSSKAKPKVNNDWLGKIDKFISGIFSEEQGKLTNFVKTATENKNLPISDVTITITGNTDRYIYARHFCNAVNNILKCNYQLFENDNKIQIVASGHALPFTLCKTTRAMADIFDKAFDKSGLAVSVSNGIITNGTESDIVSIIKNSKLALAVR